MKINYPPTAIKNLLEAMAERIAYARELSHSAGVEQKLFNLYNEVEEALGKLSLTIESNGFSMDYTNQLARTLDRLTGAFPRSYGSGVRTPIALQDTEKPIFKHQQERDQPDIEKFLLQFKIASDFFTKLDFLNRKLVIVGANGSGKTFLSEKLLKHANDNGIVVSAQRDLHLPQFDNIKSYSVTTEELKRLQVGGSTDDESHNQTVQDEFSILIQNLLADDIAAHKAYKKKAHEQSDQGMPVDKPVPTRLERALLVWNLLFPSLEIFQEDGINICAQRGSLVYPATEMSEGEKVALYLIAQVLQTPENGFVIVDEPEMYLHPTIHKRLWDKLEAERSDSIFIYLTHDLDFASSRMEAKKLWLKGFEYPESFQLEEIPKNEIPQALLMELLGSRQDILFCEGDIGSLDEKIYGILFPGYVIKPVGGCLSVINFTKAFNKLPMSNSKAIGLIDGDYLQQQRVESLKRESVFALKVPDVENLLLDASILLELQAGSASGKQYADKTKRDILMKLKQERDQEIAKYVSAKVDHYFKDSNVSSGDSLDEIKANCKKFVTNIEIDKWANERAAFVDNVIAQDDYVGAIGIFKNKSLCSVVNSNYGIKNFRQMAIQLLHENLAIQDNIRKHFPDIPARVS